MANTIPPWAGFYALWLIGSESFFQDTPTWKKAEIAIKIVQGMDAAILGLLTAFPDQRARFREARIGWHTVVSTVAKSLEDSLTEVQTLAVVEILVWLELLLSVENPITYLTQPE